YLYFQLYSNLHNDIFKTIEISKLLDLSVVTMKEKLLDLSQSIPNNSELKKVGFVQLLIKNSFT
ncbi:hypothetical protein, partial [Vibrio jasicida]|uniref:hypothetical protein n=1 Tax=Vibrio jasicida TaxID=766224 RepID=UPI001CA53291